MVQIIVAILAIAALMLAFKIALILLVLGGLIFRTRETLTLIVLVAAYFLFFRYPVVSCLLIAGSAYVVIRAKNKKEPPDPAPRLTDETGS